MKLLSVGTDAKTVKGEKKGYLTGILYLAPHTIASPRTVCPHSTPGCRAVCLYSSGRGGFTSVQKARMHKTRIWQTAPKAFLSQLRLDIVSLETQARRRGMIPAVRLNGTSDIQWERTGLMEEFPHIQFYDYTKWPNRKRPANYNLTFSYSEHALSERWSEAWNLVGVNTSAVFFGGLPDEFLGRKVIDGDLSDLRFTDPKGVIVGLKAKGKARSIKNGFVNTNTKN